jgi:hypothetical protein
VKKTKLKNEEKKKKFGACRNGADGKKEVTARKINKS